MSLSATLKCLSAWFDATTDGGYAFTTEAAEAFGDALRKAVHDAQALELGALILERGGPAEPPAGGIVAALSAGKLAFCPTPLTLRAHGFDEPDAQPADRRFGGDAADPLPSP